MLFCVVPVAPAPTRVAVDLRLADVRHLVEGATDDIGWENKDLAACMGFGGLDRISLYYRQVRTHGLNLNLLLNAGPRWWLAFIVRVCRYLGITQQQIAQAFGLAFLTEEELEREREERAAHDLQVEARLRRLERLAGVPAPTLDPPADEDGSDEQADRRGGSHRDRGGSGSGGSADAEAGDLRSV